MCEGEKRVLKRTSNYPSGWIYHPFILIMREEYEEKSLLQIKEFVWLFFNIASYSFFPHFLLDLVELHWELFLVLWELFFFVFLVCLFFLIFVINKDEKSKIFKNTAINCMTILPRLQLLGTAFVRWGLWSPQQWESGWQELDKSHL